MSSVVVPDVQIENENTDEVPERIENEREDEDEEETLKYGAKHVMMLIVPVSLCMILVIVTIRVITMYDLGSQPTVYLVYTPFNDQNKKLSTGLLF